MDLKVLFLAAALSVSLFAGCVEEGVNDAYPGAMQVFNSPDTRMIQGKLSELFYDFGNERIIAQVGGNMDIRKLWIANVSDPLVETTRVQLKHNGNYLSPSTIFSRSNMLAMHYTNPDVVAVTFCDNTSGLLHMVVPMKKIPMEFCLSLYGGGEIVIEDDLIRMGELFLTSNTPPADRLISRSGVDLIYTFQEPLFISLSDYPEGEYREVYDRSVERADWIDGRFSIEQSVYETLFSSALDCALSSFKSSNGTSALFAGTKYGEPARTYFRDGYWTSQVLLPWSAEKVKNQILTLAGGVHDNGQCPSGVLFDGEDWWSDHYDSPSFFVMLVYDYISWSGDFEILNEISGSSTIWEKMVDCVNYLQSTDTNNNTLPEKPWRCERDWADEVYRDPEVAYDSILYYRALVCMSEMAHETDEQSRIFGEQAESVRRAINEKFWDEELDYYIDYVREVPSHREDHLNEDTFIALLYGVANESQRGRYLDRATALLNSAENGRQPYGDWGVMSCYPPYQAYLLGLNGRGGDSFEASVMPYHHHNGSDWPYLDGINGMTRMWFGDENWEYPLTRWWRYSLEKRWLTPVEWYTPEPAENSKTWGFKQGWSSMPGAAILMGGFGFWPTVNGTIGLGVPPFGNSTVSFIYQGENFEISCRDDESTLFISEVPLISIDGGSRIRMKIDAQNIEIWDVRGDCSLKWYEDLSEVREDGVSIRFETGDGFSMIALERGRSYELFH